MMAEKFPESVPGREQDEVAKKWVDFLNEDERNYDRALQMIEANISRMGDDTLSKLYEVIQIYEGVEAKAEKNADQRLKNVEKGIFFGFLIGTFTSTVVLAMPALALYEYFMSEKPQRPYDRKRMEPFINRTIDIVKAESERRGLGPK